ncbi:MAG TPA: asparagine--tRNA ligase, partial [Anaerovoracaceae bacterium]|nr:asparagine--tRNA ligase [Anaerovoracaceae bacterium]
PSDYSNMAVKIRGWIRTNRSSNKFGFIELNDGSCFKSIQVVYEENIIDNFNTVSKANVSSALSVIGTLKLTPEAKQPFEIKADKILIEANSAADYPLQKKRHSLEFLREIAHLRPRSNTFSAVFRVRSLVAYAIHKFFQERGFVYVHAPIITGSDAEGAGEMFRITTLNIDSPPRTEKGVVDNKQDFFGKSTYLTVSGQLEAEAFALAFQNVYTFGPTFRAENSNTARHASEFWMIEPEVAFADLSDNMELAEDMIKFIIRYVMEKAPQEMDFFNKFVNNGLIKRLDNIVNADFQRITYTKAIELLEESKEEFQYPVEWGIDLQTEHERYITEKVYKKPVFVTDYPKDIKAFYMRLNEDEKTVSAMDLLVPGVGEIIGGSQREERYDVLLKRIEEMGLDEEDYWWYLDLRKYGGVKHSGYGLGFERIIMYITGISNIRDVIPFPRTPKSAEF